MENKGSGFFSQKKTWVNQRTWLWVMTWEY